jgi:hypothetical protein
MKSFVVNPQHAEDDGTSSRAGQALTLTSFFVLSSTPMADTLQTAFG